MFLVISDNPLHSVCLSGGSLPVSKYRSIESLENTLFSISEKCFKMLWSKCIKGLIYCQRLAAQRIHKHLPVLYPSEKSGQEYIYWHWGLKHLPIKVQNV